MFGRQAVVLWSKSGCIFQNLALEEWFLQRCAREQGPSRALLLYCNAPTVVIGRNQNPWVESNLWLLAQNEAGRGAHPETQEPVCLARRYSGGGTVVHDYGNLNFSFITPKTGFSRRKNVEWLANTLQETFPDLQLVINERNDLLCRGHKVSGSAYRLTGSAALHHGTLLVRSNLCQLRQFLSSTQLHQATDQEQMLTDIATSATKRVAKAPHGVAFDLARETLSSSVAERNLSTVGAHVHAAFSAVRGTASVRSPVMNLAEVVPCMQVNQVARVCFERFQTECSARVVSSNEIDWSSVRETATQLLDPEWILGETPAFQVHLPGLRLGHGVTVDAVLSALRKGAWLDSVALQAVDVLAEEQIVLKALQHMVEQHLQGRCRLDGAEIRTLLQQWNRFPNRSSDRRARDCLEALGDILARCLPPIHGWLRNQRTRVLGKTFSGQSMAPVPSPSSG
ncbi:hypothetical protein CCYA_CCYA03G1129 [Cyanidiococcus yangmingshanensis]|nr:hypothetical protein CCYA_CCYA03G1129 [Cyanidiococcus yangmingshanensis]